MKRYIPWIGAGAIVVIIFGTLYTSVQQTQRSDANSPQIQMAEDIAAALDASSAPSNLTTGTVNIGKSLAPFVVIYDKSGKPVAGSGRLDGKLPTVPIGILTAATNHAYHAVTWQPQSNVRIAAVTVAADKYYVLTGRSLREIEKNSTQVLWLATIGEIGSLLILGIVYVTTQRHGRR